MPGCCFALEDEPKKKRAPEREGDFNSEGFARMRPTIYLTRLNLIYVG